MLRLPPFRYLRPARLTEAASRLAQEIDRGEAVRLVAGGTDLWPNMKRRHQTAATVVSLMGIGELAGVGERPDNSLRIGATTRLDDAARDPLVAARYPALARAIDAISSPPLRQMGTLGGNLCVDTRCTYYNQTAEWRQSIDYCMKEAGTICWVAPSSPRCWAHSASDSAPVLCALGATVRLVTTEGERTAPVSALFADDGIAYLTREPREILTDILLPAEAASPHCRSAFWKLRRRGSIDFAVASVAVALWCSSDGTVERARVVLGSVGSRPVEVEAASQLLAGRPLTPEAAAAVGQAARKVATPMDNTDFQAQWRGVMVARYTEAALREAAGLPLERLAPKQPDPGLAAPSSRP
jgi:4-hydroxybenzoyl-CoA reductase subunit beta